ncbi:hypothetical protein CERZMDRAFT_99665 [Cercospora zeae-maydis SCOH1-5]|uniref:Uncharacterized protein n=1 Tax=Cercospora zeae-maydis SCOH1-5 TaxID=717836 RepID=A0A6A6FA01_9PEZI|nr:hypothetical protein CERZMDRAFT_99665 [Cercospora zeae-maydis SCOH1-5]
MPMLKSLVIASLTLTSTVMGHPAAPSPSTVIVKPHNSTANFSGPYTQASNQSSVAATATTSPVTAAGRHGGLLDNVPDYEDPVKQGFDDHLAWIDKILDIQPEAKSPLPILNEQIKFLEDTKKFVQNLAWATRWYTKYSQIDEVEDELADWDMEVDH